MIIYEANETDFFNNGLGTLPDATSALVTEERNGEFVLDVVYPQQGLRSELLTKNRIIKADAGHELKDQRFVIKKVTPTMDSDGYIYLTVHAEHVSYITADLGVTPNLTLSGNATQALEQWQANLVGGHPDIVVDSDIISEHETSLDITKATNARQVLGGVEGSILDTWGGEYKFDNLHISLRGQRGTTANTLISYGRNLLTFEQEDDITDTYTSIYPYANVGLADGNNSKLVTVDGYFVDSQYVDRYPNRKLLPVDFGSEFTDHKIGSKPSKSDSGIYTTEVEIKKKLTELAKQYIENNRIGIPKVSTKITFADLSKTSEYAPLEQVNLCDIIPIRFEKLGINTTIKVTRVVWNVLLDEYDSIELGDLRTTLGESISALESKTTGLANAVITAQSTADNQNSIFRTNGGTAEPVAKKTGDLWFKTDGDYQYMYQWDGAVWHEVVNTKTTDDIAKEVDQARVKMEELVKKANDDTTIFRTEDQEPTPTAKKKGDLWFKTGNGQTVMHEWDGQKWHEIVSTKTTEDITKQVEQARADAKALSSEVELTKKQAQEAFVKAGFNADEISNVKTATSEVTETLTSTVRQASELSESLKSVASETASRYSTVSSELSGARESLNAKASELASEVASNGANITKANSQLYSQSEGLAKVSQSATKMEQTMTDLSGRVHTVETTASETKETLADAKGNITTLTKRADGTDTKIADAQGRVQTLESRAGKWDLELSKKVDNTTYNAGIQNLGNQINLKANKSDLNGYATKAQLSVESDRITQQAGEIVTVRNLANNANDKIDRLRIGGRNLLKGTSDQFKTITEWNWMNAHTYSNYPYIDLSNFRAGDYLTYSVWVTNTSDVPIRAEIYCFDENKAHTHTALSVVTNPGDSNWLVVTMPIEINDWYARPSVITTSGQTGSHTIRMREEMLTLGNVRLPWQPSDLDLPDTIVSTVTTTTNAKQIVDKSGIYSEVTKMVDTKVGGVTTQLETYKHTVDDTGDKLNDLMGAIKFDPQSGKLTSNFNELIKTASGVRETYNELSGKIDGIVVGGKNLLDNSDSQLIMGYGIDNTTWTNGKATLVYNHDYSKTNKSSEILPQAGSRNQLYRVNKDEELTQSIIVETDATYDPNGIYQFTWFTVEFGHRPITAKVDVLGTNKYRLWCSFKWDKDQSCNMRIMDIQNLTRVLRIDNSGTYISFYHPQIERGNKPSDWGMSDNDINQKISDANVSIAKTNETIKTVDGTVTTVKNNLDKTKSVVTQLANLFDVTVGDSSISVTNNGVLVKGKQIHIDGQTLIDNGVIESAKIKSLDAGKITTGTLNAAKLNVINLNANSINAGTLSGAHLHITKDSYIDNASIDGAKIKSLDAGKITTGTLDAANVNVVNLNANNITTGTITGANLQLNLNTGYVTFMKGKLHNWDNTVDIDLDNRYLSTADSLGRIMFKGGSISITQPNIFDPDQETPYLQISNGVGSGSFSGGVIVGRDNITITNSANKDSYFLTSGLTQAKFSGLFSGKSTYAGWQPTVIGGADRGIALVGGAKMPQASSIFDSSKPLLTGSPYIYVGVKQNGIDWWGDRVFIEGDYVHIPSVRRKTTSDSPNVWVADDGALVRSTSAKKYKTNITDAVGFNYGGKLIEMVPKLWIDKAEKENYHKDPKHYARPNFYYGLIADDLDKAGLSKLVRYDKNGEVEGIAYDRIAVALLPVIKGLKDKISKLEEKIDE